MEKPMTVDNYFNNALKAIRLCKNPFPYKLEKKIVFNPN